jgi:rhamnose utilization protein RhaD (predicted bifunctional aldolase and dehydrogenase)
MRPSVSGVSEPELLAALVELSQFYGADPELVLGGGGNTSVKFEDHLLVKTSGTALAAIRPEDFVDLDRAGLQALLHTDLSNLRHEREAAFKEAVLAARRDPGREQRPSVESVLHHLLPGRFVVHLHATLVNQFSCCQNGRPLIEEQLGTDVIWVDLVDPGFVLAKTLQRELGAFTRRTGKDRPRAVIMQNHGLVTSGDSPEQIRSEVEWLWAALRSIKERVSVDVPPRPPNNDREGRRRQTGRGDRPLAAGAARRATRATDD